MEKIIREAWDLAQLEVTPQQVSSMARHRDELISWNDSINLTAIRAPDKIRVKHFLDSLSCLIAMRGTAMGSVVDVGSGAGFPGIPIKILCPAIKLVLVESIGKKVAFCEHVVQALGLRDVQIVHDRAELVGHSPAHREAHDWAVARAVASLPVLVEYLLPLVRIGGCVLAQKGESGPAEVQAAEHAIRLLGGHVRQITGYTLPGVTDERFLIVIEKVAATPAMYPRRSGKPAKRPLTS